MSTPRRCHSAPSQQPCHLCACDCECVFVCAVFCSFGSSVSTDDWRRCGFPGMTHGLVGHLVKGHWLSGVYSILPSKGSASFFSWGQSLSVVTTNSGILTPQRASLGIYIPRNGYNWKWWVNFLISKILSKTMKAKHPDSQFSIFSKRNSRLAVGFLYRFIYIHMQGRAAGS